MMDWREAVREFLNSCEFRGQIEAALITGSYAAGIQNSRSDIDILLLLSDEVDWRERGNKYVGGYLIEYFANPVRQLEREIKAGSYVTINQLRRSAVLFDRNGSAALLLALCGNSRMQLPAMPESDMKMQLYFVYDWYDELCRAYETDFPEFSMLYYIFGERAFCFYFSYTRAPMPPGTHIYRWLTDEVFREKYGLPEHPDAEFTDKLTEFIRADGRDEKLSCAKALYEHVTGAAGGFDIGSFISRSPCP